MNAWESVGDKDPWIECSNTSWRVSTVGQFGLEGVRDTRLLRIALAPQGSTLGINLDYIPQTSHESSQFVQYEGGYWKNWREEEKRTTFSNIFF